MIFSPLRVLTPRCGAPHEAPGARARRGRRRNHCLPTCRRRATPVRAVPGRTAWLPRREHRPAESSSAAAALKCIANILEADTLLPSAASISAAVSSAQALFASAAPVDGGAPRATATERAPVSAARKNWKARPRPARHPTASGTTPSHPARDVSYSEPQASPEPK